MMAEKHKEVAGTHPPSPKDTFDTNICYKYLQFCIVIVVRFCVNENRISLMTYAIVWHIQVLHL